MPHVNLDGIDLVVSCFIVHPEEPKVLLVDHVKLGGWFAIGGHVGDKDKQEDPDQAMDKEIREECGLEVDFIDRAFSFDRYRPAFDPATNHNSRPLRTPWAVEMHDFPPVPGHRHLALVYVAKARTATPVLEVGAHKEVRWFGHEDLEDPQYRERMLGTIRWYAHEVILRACGEGYKYSKAFREQAGETLLMQKYEDARAGHGDTG